MLKSSLFYRDFERRLYRLYNSLSNVFGEDREADLFPCLFQVYSYVWSHHGIDGCRLDSNPNKRSRPL